jgi:hypothetical protein
LCHVVCHDCAAILQVALSLHSLLVSFAHTGQVDVDELAAVLETLASKRSTIRHMRVLIALLVCGWPAAK